MKKLCLSVAVMACVAASSFAGTITWGSADLGGTYSDGWLVELVEDVGLDGITITTLFDDHTIVGGDSFISTPITTAIAAGKGGTTWGDTFNAPGSSLALSDQVYSVIYNAATFGAATQFIIADASPYTLPATDIDAAYTVTSVSGSWRPITPVPEPGSIILFALGLVTLAARRKRR
jgi:hypothetical protein